MACAARAYEGSNQPQVLRQALGYLLALTMQRWTWHRRLTYSEPVVTRCLCGCGETVVGSRFGMPKLYVSHAHVERASYRRRKRQAA
jgi:hypothetical protein